MRRLRSWRPSTNCIRPRLQLESERRSRSWPRRSQGQHDDLARVSRTRSGQSSHRRSPAARAGSCPPLRFPGRVVTSVPRHSAFQALSRRQLHQRPTAHAPAASWLSQSRRPVNAIVSQFLSKLLHANRSLSHANRVSGRSFPALRETVFGPRDRRPQTASEQFFSLAETGSQPMHPRKIAGIRQTTGNQTVMSEARSPDDPDSRRGPNVGFPMPSYFSPSLSWWLHSRLLAKRPRTAQ